MFEPLLMHLYWCISEPMFNPKKGVWQEAGCHRAASFLAPDECEGWARLNASPKVPYLCVHAGQRPQK